MVYGIIMAGGSGTRFWPKSRTTFPKQCLALFTQKSIFEETIDIYSHIIKKENIIVATGSHLTPFLKQQAPDVQYSVEPMPKNTAACIGLALLSIPDKEIVIIGTSDHVFQAPELYLAHLHTAVKAAEKGMIVQIGIKPTRVETGYGYIEVGQELMQENSISVFRVASFKEKPMHKVAKNYIDSKRFLWNAGIFVSQAAVLMEEFRRYMPSLYQGLQEVRASNHAPSVISNVFERIESISIDKGIIERTTKNVVVKGDFPWDDVGDWGALARFLPTDSHKNVVVGEFSGDASHCIIFSDRRVVKCSDAEDLIIVDTEDATLICDCSRAQDVRKVTELLRKADLGEYVDGFVKEHKPNNIVIDADNCDVESDGITALIGVNNLTIKRTKDQLIINDEGE